MVGVLVRRHGSLVVASNSRCATAGRIGKAEFAVPAELRVVQGRSAVIVGRVVCSDGVAVLRRGHAYWVNHARAKERLVEVAL